MKKIMLAAIGLTGLLASCGDLAPTKTLRLTEVTDFRTGYTTPTALKDSQGNQIANAGDYIICNNMQTKIRVKFNWTGDLNYVQFRLKGLSTGNVTSAVTIYYPSGFIDGGAEATLGKGVAPQAANGSVGTQSIVPTPVVVTKLYGRSYLQMRIFDTYDRAGTVASSADGITFESATAIPIVDCQ